MSYYYNKSEGWRQTSQSCGFLFCLHNIYHMKACQSQFTLTVFTLRLCYEQRKHICSLPSLAKNQYSLSAPTFRRKSASSKNVINSKLNQPYILPASAVGANKDNEFKPQLFPHVKGFLCLFALITSCQPTPTFRQFWWRFKACFHFFSADDFQSSFTEYLVLPHHCMGPDEQNLFSLCRK